MVKVRIFLFVVCFAWMFFDEIHGDVQVFNESDDGNGQQNISVNIHGSNGGNICIDCQNQIQIDDSSMEDDNHHGNLGDLQPFLDVNSGLQPFFYAQPSLNTRPVLISDNPGSEFGISVKQDAEIPDQLYQFSDDKKPEDE
ncbi:hypothetical protein ACLKA6_003931 [Drosophila palustris]